MTEQSNRLLNRRYRPTCRCLTLFVAFLSCRLFRDAKRWKNMRHVYIHETSLPSLSFSAGWNFSRYLSLYLLIWRNEFTLSISFALVISLRHLSLETSDVAHWSSPCISDVNSGLKRLQCWNVAGIRTTMAFNSAKRDEDCEARDARVTIIDSSPATARGEIGSCFSKSPQSVGVEIYRCSVAGRAVLRLFRFRPSGEQRSSGVLALPLWTFRRRREKQHESFFSNSTCRFRS